MSDSDLEAALYANRRSKRGHRRHAEPDWPSVHRELKRKHVTLMIVWDEHIAANPGGYSYSRYVAVALMWSSAPFPLLAARLWESLTQHKSGPRLTNLSHLRVRHG
jgi:hypothetical protein